MNALTKKGAETFTVTTLDPGLIDLAQSVLPDHGSPSIQHQLSETELLAKTLQSSLKLLFQDSSVAQEWQFINRVGVSKYEPTGKVESSCLPTSSEPGFMQHIYSVVADPRLEEVLTNYNELSARAKSLIAQGRFQSGKAVCEELYMLVSNWVASFNLSPVSAETGIQIDFNITCPETCAGSLTISYPGLCS